MLPTPYSSSPWARRCRPPWLTTLMLCLLPWLCIPTAQPQAATPPPPNTPQILHTGFIADPCPTASVHAASLAELPSGDIISVWYGGTREGHRDVCLYQSQLKKGSQTWSTPVVIASSQSLQRELLRPVRKLGNPALVVTPDGQLKLYFVTVKFGGWSCSSVNVKTSTDGGASWSPAKHLVNSPFLNISTLVRCQASVIDDNTICLPIYHELMGLFSELLYVSTDDEVVGKSRLTSGRRTIQPCLVPLSKDRMAVLHRNTGAGGDNGLWYQTTHDGGRHWTNLQPTNLSNEQTSIDAVAYGHGELLMVYNEVPTERPANSYGQRSQLSLAKSSDLGKTWNPILVLEEKTGSEFSYPAVIRSRDNHIHVAYTWNRTHIKYARVDPGDTESTIEPTPLSAPDKNWPNSWRWHHPNLPKVQSFLGMIGYPLFLSWLGVGVWKRIRKVRKRDRQQLVIGIIILILALIPIAGLSTGEWLRGYIDDLSITSTFLILSLVSQRFFGIRWIGRKNVRNILIASLILGLLFYPASLGLTTFDPYSSGYGVGVLTLSSLSLVLAALLFRWNAGLSTLLVLAFISYHLNLLPSDNWWNYFTDVPLFFVALGFALNKAKTFSRWRRLKRRKSAQNPTLTGDLETSPA